ncbi:hypothetical protein TVAG_231400 [Trichomonas vaginalis G3]|uniref:Uncharacterized protein n=1 Tax=Trichomonas vaginalis (strain ATCC PRA-98 / G3) TaxID=412133 RepID=A2F2U0_TRIV3|nr:RNA binding [Trichomonas vaginalis G3]EAY00800.1 hypothetical protein TVAG_231400 [Trichomonas vaginalis G3]KAI5518654.1 RNA binding [Trichomonas vaginalis G3]|eukprot:XP_001313729.1 hypothetical protein [Trichomonas vaginalis G3]
MTSNYRKMKAFASLLGFSHDVSREAKLRPYKYIIEYLYSDFNNEKNPEIQKKIEESQHNFIDIGVFDNIPIIKKLSGALEPEDKLDAMQAIDFFEVDTTAHTIKLKKPITPDPRRKYRTIRVSGIDREAPTHLQYQFFKSNNLDVRAMYPCYTIDGDEVVYSGTTIVELGSEGEAKIAALSKIEYAGGLLDVTVFSDYQEKLQNQRNEQKEETRRSPRKFTRN